MSVTDPNARAREVDAPADEELAVEDLVGLEPAGPQPAFAPEGDAEESTARRVSGARVPPAAEPVRHAPISGCYRSCPDPWELTLRVDVDGRRPQRRLSGDYFRHSGATTAYFGSFRVEALSISVSSTVVTITGTATTSWTTPYNRLRVVIPRHKAGQPAATAYVRWLSAANEPGAEYVAPFASKYFRTVVLEQDHEVGVEPFQEYDTASLPAGGPSRVLTVASAYGEAGVHMEDSGQSDEVPAAPGGTWSNAELHAAMENHFSRWRDVPQWKVWLLHAYAHEMGPGLYGIMFDQKGPQRQGCASFYQGVGGTSAAKLRDQLYVHVHELGHCFNLFHSFHKKYMEPPMPNRLDALSWMNYPQNYPGGPASFWSSFPFQFDNLELIHLRHAMYNDIVFGANPFGKGAALDVTGDYADAISDRSGVDLVLEAPKPLRFGEPAVVEIQLRLRDLHGKEVHSQLHPNFGNVQLAIERPGGETIPYQPPLQHCAEVTTAWLDASRPAVYESAYIGFDKHEQQVFDQPGTYRVRGAYFAFDGSIVLSNVLTLRIPPPALQEDVEVAELMLGDEQGMLLYLLGSDGPTLRRGNDALDEVIERHGEHELAAYARLAKGFGLAREFKHLSADNSMEVRAPERPEAEQLLQQAVEVSKGTAGLDNISLNLAMRELAHVQHDEGATGRAQETLTDMVETFAQKGLPEHVMAHIREQARL